MSIADTKYKRLCIVLVPILAVLGGLNAHYLKPYYRYTRILCSYDLRAEETCVPYRADSDVYYDAALRRQKAWFDIFPRWDRDGYLAFLSSAATRPLRMTKIVSAEPLLGVRMPRSPQFLVGSTGIITLGMESGAKSTEISGGGVVLLQCNSLYMIDTPDLYTSQCYRDGWGGAITYGLDAGSTEVVEHLMSRLNGTIEKVKADYLTYRLVMYPVFVVAFFIISALVWAVVVATRFIRAGRA